MSIEITDRIKSIVYIIFIIFVFNSTNFAQNLKEIDNRAQKYYNNKEFGKAISEWLTMLEIDPDNEDVQRKIEMVYDEKHKKDISLQKATLYYKLAYKTMKSNIKVAESNTKNAVKNFIIAYRIDPKDPELQVMKEEMKELDETMKIELAKNRLSEEIKKSYFVLLAQANKEMDEEKYESALKVWDKILFLVPVDDIAKEGKRKAQLAIANRLKFERIKALLESGIKLFVAKEYIKSKLEFVQALRIDPENKEAESYIDRIDELLQDKKNYEMRMMQAEQFYISGIRGLRGKNFDQAEEDFLNVLALIDNYKDTKERLESIKRLREQYEEQERIRKLRKIDEQFRNGLLALAEGQYKKAVMFFEATLALDPGNSLSKRYIKSSKEALKQIGEESVDKDSPYYEVINSLVVSGTILYDQGDYIESRRRWEKILKLFPKNRIATEFLLKCNMRLNPESFNKFAKTIVDEGKRFRANKKYSIALRKFELIKAISPEYPNIDKLIASVKKKPIRRISVEESTRETNVSPIEIERRYKIGLNYYRKGGRNNITRALREFKWVALNDPENIKAVININKIEAQLRFASAGQTRTVKKLTIEQQRKLRVHYFNGINYYSNNNFNKAIGEWRKVLAIDPTYEKAKINIRKCLALMTR